MPRVVIQDPQSVSALLLAAVTQGFTDLGNFLGDNSSFLSTIGFFGLFLIGYWVLPKITRKAALFVCAAVMILADLLVVPVILFVKRRLQEEERDTGSPYASLRGSQLGKPADPAPAN